jgi:hypothetical protein
MNIQRLTEILDYNPSSGLITYRHNGKTLEIMEDRLVKVKDPETKQQRKFKMEKLCYSLAFGVELDKSDKIIHRNLNDSDFTTINLMQVTPEQYKEIKEAWKNIQGGIRLVIHPTDVYSYKLYWFESGTERSKVVQDVVVAKRMERRLIIKYSKILTKYCISD